MPSIRYFNESAPFWDFVASVEDQVANHPFFSGSNAEYETVNQAQASSDEETAKGNENTAKVPEKAPQDNEDEGEKPKPYPGKGKGPCRRGHCGPGGERGRWHHGRRGGRFGGGFPGAAFTNPWGFNMGSSPINVAFDGEGPAPPYDAAGQSPPPQPFGGPFGGPFSGPFGGPFGGPHRQMPPWARAWHKFGGMHHAQSQASEKDYQPPVDIFNTPSAYILHFSIPGAKKEDVGINWLSEKSELSVAGVIYRPSNGNAENQEEFLKTLEMTERTIGAFERKVRLGNERYPANVEEDEITAKLEDGVLIVTLPKIGKEEDDGFVEVKKVDIE